MKPIIKICGITTASDALMCAGAGADWLGFIFHPQSPRCARPEMAADFDTGQARRVGVFVNQTAAEVLKIMETARLDLAQLHGGQSADFCREIGPARVIRVFWPQKYAADDDFRRDRDSLAEAAAYFLYDAGTSGGGHGTPLDPQLINETPPRPWLLAGGLSAERMGGLNTAIPAYQNFMGFDFNSGVEKSPGRKDKFLVESAIMAARNVAATIADHSLR